MLQPAAFAHNLHVSRARPKKSARKAKKAVSSKRKSPGVVIVRGKRVPSFGADLVLIRTARFKTPAKSSKPSEEARVLARRAGEALTKPGISDHPVKKSRSLYSVDPANPERIVRKSADGKTSVGRLVGYRFRADD